MFDCTQCISNLQHVFFFYAETLKNLQPNILTSVRNNLIFVLEINQKYCIHNIIYIDLLLEQVSYCLDPFLDGSILI